jgi:hypothetical protein
MEHFRPRIIVITMGMGMFANYRRPPRGRPSIGFQLEVPREVEVREGSVLLCREVREDGRVRGELEVSVFAAALIIDRDGLLAEKAREGIDRETRGHGDAVAVAVSLPGASGFLAEAAAAVRDTPLPYVSVFAVAPHDLGVDGGVLVTIRTARPEWPAAEHMLHSLRVLTRHGVAAASEVGEAAPILPMVGATR